MRLWLVLILLAVVALAFVVWPLYRSSRLSGLLTVVVVVIVGLSGALYHTIGQPGVASGPGERPDIGEMLSSLEQRLKASPDDAAGWLMLGRSYQSMQRYEEAVDAFEKAIELEDRKIANSVVALGMVMLERDGGGMSNRAADLFEEALLLDPNNSNALFYGGSAAARRGDLALAADRWEPLLQRNAPADIQKLLHDKINEWRALLPMGSQQLPAVKQVVISVSVSEQARQALPENATVFIIARDPEQPSPPIAVSRRSLSELPAVVALSDDDAMMAGRLLSGFSRLEIIARASMSGQPMPQSGDWSGSSVINTDDEQSVDLVIGQPVP